MMSSMYRVIAALLGEVIKNLLRILVIVVEVPYSWVLLIGVTLIHSILLDRGCQMDELLICLWYSWVLLIGITLSHSILLDRGCQMDELLMICLWGVVMKMLWIIHSGSLLGVCMLVYYMRSSCMV